MKKYQNKLLQEYFKKVLDYRGHSIFDVEHSVERYKERIGKDIFIYEKLLKKGINWIIDNKKENTEDRYIFMSKRYGFGIQVHWRAGRNPKEGFNGYTATTLSKDEMNYFTQADKQLFLENLKDESNAQEIVSKGYARFFFKESLQKEMDLCYYEMFIQSGEIHYTFELIKL